MDKKALKAKEIASALLKSQAAAAAPGVGDVVV